MWQRIQTIFLILASGSCWSLFLKPLGLAGVSGDLASVQGTPLADGVLHLLEQPALIALSALAGIASLIAVFLYKNRKTQIRVTQLSVVLAFALLIAVLALFYVDFKKISAATYVFQPGLLLPFTSIIAGVLAIFNIRKDDKIVRSMDRLR
jgi:peptidoglycan/LPS O-acetylase OafA/YrhL